METTGLVPARIVADGKAEMWLAGCTARLGSLTGKLRDDKASRPVIGDWAPSILPGGQTGTRIRHSNVVST